jgi:hypothetical protein
MSDFASWCASLEGLVEAGGRGEPLDLAVVTALAERARALGPSLDQAQRLHVKRCISKLADIVRDGLGQLDRELADLNERRVGIRGYGQLRSTHVAQRLRRRA